MSGSTKKPIAICVGHSRGDGGAVGVGGMNEWNYNRKVAAYLGEILSDRGQHVVVIDRYAQAGYGTAITYLAKQLKSLGARCAVELHFNSAQATAHGHEWLYWHSSVAGRALAQCLERRMSEWLPETRKRGLVAITTEKSRGGVFLRRTHCPAVIAEPFFGSHPQSWEFFKDNQQGLAQMIADGIDDWCGL